jgi:hypothetical protein
MIADLPPSGGAGVLAEVEQALSREMVTFVTDAYSRKIVN